MINLTQIVRGISEAFLILFFLARSSQSDESRLHIRGSALFLTTSTLLTFYLHYFLPLAEECLTSDCDVQQSH